MTRRTILLGLAGSLVSLPLSLGTHPFLSDPEEVGQPRLARANAQ